MAQRPLIPESLQSQDTESFWKPDLSAEQIAWCREALKQLELKAEIKISEEFSSLTRSYTAGTMERMRAGQLSVNLPKNRYMSLLPFDDTRVVLHPYGDMQSDYINASFITPPSGKDIPAIIAAQGPLRSTMVDFWEMVFQQKCSAILMLTHLSTGFGESGAYLPSTVNETRVFGRIRVTTKNLSCSRHKITKRVLEVKCIEQPDEPSLMVVHFQFDWPDFGLPCTTGPVRELFRSLYSVPCTGPAVVHCSAGIGRSGTYITIDQTLRRILSGDMSAVNIKDTVQHIRQQRIGMVETKAQYEYCYAAVIDELVSLVSML